MGIEKERLSKCKMGSVIREGGGLKDSTRKTKNVLFKIKRKKSCPGKGNGMIETPEGGRNLIQLGN